MSNKGSAILFEDCSGITINTLVGNTDSTLLQVTKSENIQIGQVVHTTNNIEENSIRIQSVKPYPSLLDLENFKKNQPLNKPRRSYLAYWIQRIMYQ